MNRLLTGTLGLAAVLFLPVAAFAGAASERLFTEGVLSSVELGTELVYSHTRVGAERSELIQWIDDGEMRVALKTGQDGSKEAVISMHSEGKKRRELTPLPVSIGNPILITFLESSLRAMANLTGGSPFYIRNRIKASLRDGGTLTQIQAEVDGKMVEAQQIVFIPFQHDKNRDKMGDFADLQLRFVMSDTAPGGFVLFSAATRPHADGAIAFQEEIAYRTSVAGE